MGTADTDGKAAAFHQLTDQITAFNLRNSKFRGFSTFCIFSGNRCRVNDYVYALHILRLMSDVNLNTLFSQMIRLMGTGLVRTAYNVSLIMQRARKTGHRTAADADKMNPAAMIITNVLNHLGISPNSIYFVAEWQVIITIYIIL